MNDDLRPDIELRDSPRQWFFPIEISGDVAIDGDGYWERLTRPDHTCEPPVIYRFAKPEHTRRSPCCKIGDRWRCACGRLHTVATSGPGFSLYGWRDEDGEWHQSGSW